MIESLKSKLIKEGAVAKPKLEKEKARSQEPLEERSEPAPETDETGIADDAENIFVCVPCGKVTEVYFG